MEQYYCVTIFHLQDSEEKSAVESIAFDEYEASGIEEFNLSEAEVDRLLGARSYSGGDLPIEVLDEVEEKVAHNINLKIFFSNVSKAQSFMSDVIANYLVEAQIEKIKNEDWNSEWKKHFQPIIVDEDFSVIPSWYLEEGKYTKLSDVYIYPGMGFGTGSHETTWMCLKFLCDLVKNNTQIKTALDFGSGSGILGIALLKKYPASLVDFVDIDPLANENALKNLNINQLQNTKFHIYLTSEKNKLEKYDLIFANILLNVLEDEGQFLFEKLNSNGKIIISGILGHQSQTLIHAYQKIGFRFIDQINKGDWSAVLMEKKA